MKHQHQGFSLVELMIVVAIVGIISSIAYPSYSEYIQRGHRAEARAALLQSAQWLERAATATGTYPLAAAFPTTLTKVPSNRYTIAMPAASSTTQGYTLTATPKSGTPQAKDKCGIYTLDNSGVRGVASATLSVTDCWSK